MSDHSSDHFKDKDALGHVIEAHAQGIISAAEVHGTEIPGNYSAGADAGRETAFLLTLLLLLLIFIEMPFSKSFAILTTFSIGLAFWKAGRSAWLGWFRLERLHRVLAQERWEIENYRQQERDELRVLYAAKGFEGKLLEDVLDVLMADNDRLLKIMVEEELGLSLATCQHPLEQALGALIGVIATSAVCLVSFWIYPAYGLLVGALVSVGISSYIAAHLSQNDPVSAIVWNLGILGLAVGIVYFLLEYLIVIGLW